MKQRRKFDLETEAAEGYESLCAVVAKDGTPVKAWKEHRPLFRKAFVCGYAAALCRAMKGKKARV